MNNIFLRKALNIDNNRFTGYLGIFLYLYTCENLRGAGYWKLNNSLLENTTFCSELESFTREDTQRLEKEDPVCKWEYAKINKKNY